MKVVEAIAAILIVLACLGSVVFSLYYFLRARHQQRMAMIEKGYEPPAPQKKDRSLLPLKWGVFFIGISIGLFLGYVIATVTRINGVISYFSMILLFGGAGLIFNYYLESRIKRSGS